MTVVINGTSGITDVNGTAAAPAITGTDTDTGVFFGTNTVSLSTGGTERLQVDSSGNLGLGVTPSAWKSNYKVTQVGNAAAIIGRTDNNNNYFSSNWYVNSSNQDIYQNNGYATVYSQGTGTHAWYTAASGSAGGTITFTQAMTLDASGNLMLGTTSVGTMAGNIVQRLANTGIIPRTSNSLANNGTLNIVVSSGGASFTGFLIVESVLISNANVRTQTTYSVFGRGTSLTATSIATVNGPSGGRTFTITAPSTGVISFTNTSGDTVGVNMTFFGSEGF